MYRLKAAHVGPLELKDWVISPYRSPPDKGDLGGFSCYLPGLKASVNQLHIVLLWSTVPIYRHIAPLERRQNQVVGSKFPHPRGLGDPTLTDSIFPSPFLHLSRVRFEVGARCPSYGCVGRNYGKRRVPTISRYSVLPRPLASPLPCFLSCKSFNRGGS